MCRTVKHYSLYIVYMSLFTASTTLMSSVPAVLLRRPRLDQARSRRRRHVQAAHRASPQVSVSTSVAARRTAPKRINRGSCTPPVTSLSLLSRSSASVEILLRQAARMRMRMRMRRESAQESASRWCRAPEAMRLISRAHPKANMKFQRMGRPRQSVSMSTRSRLIWVGSSSTSATTNTALVQTSALILMKRRASSPPSFTQVKRAAS